MAALLALVAAAAVDVADKGSTSRAAKGTAPGGATSDGGAGAACVAARR